VHALSEIMLPQRLKPHKVSLLMYGLKPVPFSTFSSL
jgi:hypothetical protein